MLRGIKNLKLRAQIPIRGLQLNAGCVLWWCFAHSSRYKTAHAGHMHTPAEFTHCREEGDRGGWEEETEEGAIVRLQLTLFLFDCVELARTLCTESSSHGSAT